MKFAVLISRLLLGLMFIVFGLNGFLHFIPSKPISGLALQYMTVLTISHIFMVVFLLEIVGGVLLLINRYVPLGLVILAPILVNILMFHTLMQPAGIPPGLVATLLWFVVYSSVKSAFAGIIVSK